MKRLLLIFSLVMIASILNGAEPKQMINRRTTQTAEARHPHGIPGWDALLAEAKNASETGKGTPEKPFKITVPKGIYHFYADQCPEETYYVSNAEQENPKFPAIVLRGLKNIAFDFSGSEILTHGKVFPVVMEDCENCALSNFHLDSPTPMNQQAKIVKNDENGIVLKMAPWVRYRFDEGEFLFVSDLWEGTINRGMVYNPTTKHVLHGVAGFTADLTGAREMGEGLILCPNWKDDALPVGTVTVFRPIYITHAGIFLYHNKNTRLENIQIHYVQSKAVVAQRCENIYCDNVSLVFRGEDDPRFFTGDADAVHFNGCKGEIVCENCVFESMMDDSINVHGSYLKVSKRIDARTIEASFTNDQAWGFEWGGPGETVQFNDGGTMDLFEGTWTIESIRAVDAPTFFGAKTFEIRFTSDLPDFIKADGRCALENLTWTASVVYRNNIVRNNRARACLFSTPKPILVEGNLFDHVSGSAILCCGDCDYWMESGPCRDVTIRNNRFINCMACFYQYCRGVISIFPNIPDFENQKGYYYGGKPDAFVIENNLFETFDLPILYGRSVDGVVFRNNVIRHNDDYPRVSEKIKVPFFFEQADQIWIEGNDFDKGFDPAVDVKTERVPEGGIRFQ